MTTAPSADVKPKPCSGRVAGTVRDQDDAVLEGVTIVLTKEVKRPPRMSHFEDNDDDDDNVAISDKAGVFSIAAVATPGQTLTAYFADSTFVGPLPACADHLKIRVNTEAPGGEILPLDLR